MMKLKVEEEYSYLKLFFFIFFCFFFFFFLIILLVSILFSASNRFDCYFRLLNFTLRKNRLNTVYASDGIQQERLPVSLKVVRIYF